MGERETHLLRLLPLLQQILIRVGAHRTKTGMDLGLTNLQLGALGAVYRHSNCMMSDLAQDMFVVPPAATRIVDELVGKNLIERIADDKDRRVVRLRITEQGREAVDRVHQEASVLLAQVLEEMGEEEQLALLKGLQGFINAVMEVEEEG